MAANRGAADHCPCSAQWMLGQHCNSIHPSSSITVSGAVGEHRPQILGSAPRVLFLLCTLLCTQPLLLQGSLCQRSWIRRGFQPQAPLQFLDPGNRWTSSLPLSSRFIPDSGAELLPPPQPLTGAGRRSDGRHWSSHKALVKLSVLEQCAPSQPSIFACKEYSQPDGTGFALDHEAAGSSQMTATQQAHS